MASTGKSGLLLNDVITKLDNFAPKSLAESWDNVGLLVQPMSEKNVKRILLTNDLTEDVMEEAVKLCVDLIISYHPPIFAPLKSITGRTWKVIFQCYIYIFQCCHLILLFLLLVPFTPLLLLLLLPLLPLLPPPPLLLLLLLGGVGYMDVVEALLPYRNATNIFLPISKQIFILQNIN
jgi:hypothetical protein